MSFSPHLVERTRARVSDADRAATITPLDRLAAHLIGPHFRHALYVGATNVLIARHGGGTTRLGPRHGRSDRSMSNRIAHNSALLGQSERQGANHVPRASMESASPRRRRVSAKLLSRESKP